MEKKDLPPKRKIGYNMGGGFFKAAKQSAEENNISGLFPRSTLLFRRFRNFFLQLLARHLPIPRGRVFLHKMRGVHIGSGVQIGPLVTLENPFPDAIFLDDFAAIGNEAVIIGHTKPPIFHDGRLPSIVDPVLIQKGAWVGINAIILPGVVVGEGSIVSAGSVVSRDVPPYTIVRGNPAEVIAKIKPAKKKAVG